MIDNIRKIFDMLGVKPNERFTIKRGNKISEEVYYFDEKLDIYSESHGLIYTTILNKLLNGIYEIVKLPKKKKKLRDLTVEEYEKCLAKYCKNGHIECKGCIFSGTDCSIKFGWINHKDLYSDKFLDQEIEVKE